MKLRSDQRGPLLPNAVDSLQLGHGSLTKGFPGRKLRCDLFGSMSPNAVNGPKFMEQRQIYSLFTRAFFLPMPPFCRQSGPAFIEQRLVYYLFTRAFFLPMPPFYRQW